MEGLNWTVAGPTGTMEDRTPGDFHPRRVLYGVIRVVREVRMDTASEDFALLFVVIRT